MGAKRCVSSPPRRRRHARLRRVADRLQAGAGGDRDRERRLEARLVERGIGGPGVGRFELRPGVPLVADLDVVHARGAVAERRVVVEHQRRRACGQSLGEVEADHAGGVDLRPGRGHGGLADQNHGLGHPKVAPVHVDAPRARRHRHVDLHMAREARLVRQHGQVQPVGRGDRAAGRELALGCVRVWLDRGRGGGRGLGCGLPRGLGPGGRRRARGAEHGGAGPGQQVSQHRSPPPSGRGAHRPRPGVDTRTLGPRSRLAQVKCR